MKKYKAFDFYIQVISLTLIGVTILINESLKINPFIFLLSYMGAQAISMVLHFFTGLQTWKKTTWRKYHVIGVGVVAILLVVAVFQDSAGRSGGTDDKYGMPGLPTLIWATIPAILTSFFYIIITWQEWMNIKQRNLVRLK